MRKLKRWFEGGAVALMAWALVSVGGLAIPGKVNALQAAHAYNQSGCPIQSGAWLWIFNSSHVHPSEEINMAFAGFMSYQFVYFPGESLGTCRDLSWVILDGGYEG